MDQPPSQPGSEAVCHGRHERLSKRRQCATDPETAVAFLVVEVKVAEVLGFERGHSGKIRE